MYIHVPVRRGLGATVGPFNGTFTGKFDGDAGTSTAITATFTHSDNTIQGTIGLGAGLQLDFGKPCAIEPVDIRVIPISTTWDPLQPNHVEATTQISEPTTQFGYKTIDIRITIVADFVDSSQTTIKASVTMKLLGVLPRACGSKTFPVVLTKKP